MATCEQSDHENNYMFCSPCKLKGSEILAAKYCRDCSDYYCFNCVSAHDNFPALSGHKLIDMDELKESDIEVIYDVPTERCERHSFKPIDIFCRDHDTVGCNTCMVIEHRSCKNVFYVPMYVLHHDPTSQCKDIQKKMSDVNDDIIHQLILRQREIKRLCKKKLEEVEKIKQFRVEIDRKLDDMERKSIDAIEEKYKALIKRIEDEIATLTTFQTDVHSSTEDIKSSRSNLSQQFVGMKLANLVKERAVKYVKVTTVEFRRNDIVFDCKQKLISVIDGVNTFGDIIEKPALNKLEGKREINIKLGSDSESCNVRSMCILNDGSVIIADIANRRLKRLHGSSFKVEELCKLPKAPWQICQMEKYIAVSTGGKNSIYFVNTDCRVKKVREMATSHGCYGLGYKNGLLYVTDSMKSVFVYNKTGALMTQYYKDHSGQRLFSNIYSLTVSLDGEKLYVADDKYGLVVLSKEGKLHEKYKTSKLSGPREICETDSGDIIVCGESSNNIIQFSPNGEVLGEILQTDDSVEFCQSVCFDRSSSRLIVGRIIKDYIEVYNMIETIQFT